MSKKKDRALCNSCYTKASAKQRLAADTAPEREIDPCGQCESVSPARGGWAVYRRVMAESCDQDRAEWLNRQSSHDLLTLLRFAYETRGSGWPTIKQISEALAATAPK